MNNIENMKLLHNKLLETILYIDEICVQFNIPYYLCGGTAIGAVRHAGFIPWDDDLDIMMTPENYIRFLDVISKKKDDRFYLQRDTVDYPLQFSKLRLHNTTFIEKPKYRKKWKHMHQGIFVDIFPLEYAAKNSFLFNLQYICARVVIAQSLFLRGYSTASVLKKCIMAISMLFIIFRTSLIHFVRSSTINNSCGYCDFWGSKVKETIPFEMLGIGKRIPFENFFLPVPDDVEGYLHMQYGNYMDFPPEPERLEKMHAKFFSDKIDYSNFL